MSSLRNVYYNSVYGKKPVPPKTQSRRPFLNPIYGNNLAQNVPFAGTPILINNGGDAVGWTPTIVQGSWDIASTINPYAETFCVELTAGSNGDTLNLSTGSPVDGSNYIAIDLRIRLETWNSSNNSMFLQFKNAGLPVGNLLSIGTFINEAILNQYQHAVIPITLVGIEAETFDEVDISITRSGGPSPVFRFDNFYIQETGGLIEFKAGPNLQADPPELFRAEKIRFTFIATITGNAAIKYDDILGNTLSNGLLISRVINGVQITGRSISTRADFLAFDFNTAEFIDDGVSSTWAVDVIFEEPFVLRAKTGDFIAVEVQDDLTGFIRAEALLTGTFELEI